MGDRRCCCPECKVGDDDFTRPVDGPVPPDDPKWIDVQGNRWAFQNGLLVPTTTAWAPVVTRIRNHRVAPRPPAVKRYNYVIYFRAVNIGPANPSLGIIVRYDGASVAEWIRLDAEPPLYQRLWPTFLRGNTVLMDRTTHPDTDPFSIRAGEFTGRICFSDVEWSITESAMATPELGSGRSADDYMWTLCGGGADHLPSDTGFAGFLHGQFDSWELWDHWEVDRTCPRCACFCWNRLNLLDYSCLPEHLMATFVPLHSTLAYSSPGLDFLELPLHQRTTFDWDLYPPFPKSAAKVHWFSEELDHLHPFNERISLRCISYAGEGLGNIQLRANLLHFPWAHAPPWYAQYQYVDWNVSTCRPLHLVFRSLTASVSHCHTEQPPRLQVTADPFADCILETPENKALLDSLRWNIVIEEAA